MSGGRTAIVLLAFLLAAAGPAAAQHKVSGVAANDELNIRSAPNADASIVGRIPPNGRGIRVIGGGNRFWVKVAYGGKTGFVNRRFIRKDTALAAAAPKRAASSRDALDEPYTGPVPANTASVIVQPAALPAAVPESAKPKQSVPRAAGIPKKDTRAPAMTLESGPASPASAPGRAAVTDVPATTVLAAPAVPAPDADSAPTTLVAPPQEMLTQALPNSLACAGDKPGWSLAIANGVSTFQSAGQQEVLEFGELKQSAAQSDVWMAGGRNFASQLSLHIHQTGTCKSGSAASASPYDVSLRLNDGRVLTGCCRAAN
jgi:uncharacterized membrane protein